MTTKHVLAGCQTSVEQRKLLCPTPAPTKDKNYGDVKVRLTTTFFECTQIGV